MQTFWNPMANLLGTNEKGKFIVETSMSMIKTYILQFYRSCVFFHSDLVSQVEIYRKYSFVVHCNSGH